MSKPIFEDIFSFSGRRNRASYNWYQVWLVVAALLLFPIGIWTKFFGFVLLVPLAISAWAVTAQRVRDLGYSGWFSVLTMIPYVGVVVWLFLCFQRGTGDNAFGPAIVSGSNTPLVDRPRWSE